METVERIRAAHQSARPKPQVNPAWANAEHDIGVLLTEWDARQVLIANLLAALDPDELNPEQFIAYCALDALSRPIPEKD